MFVQIQKKYQFILLTLMTLFLAGCETFNSQLATSAAVDVIQAVTLSDGQIRQLSQQTADNLDSKHTLAPENNPYHQRLARLIAPHQNISGIQFDFRVYLKGDVNAFALPNGTIRVYSGLMDKLTDDELFFVIGHEIGHVIEGHSKRAAQVTYTTSAARKGVAALGGKPGAIAQSAIGEFSAQLISAQFSQHEERQADDYGLNFIRNHQTNPAAAVSALRKLGNQGGGLLSSHPNPQDRANRLESKL